MAKNPTSILSLAFIALTASPIAAFYPSFESVVAQSPSPTPSFSLPQSVPTGTTVKVDGSPSMTVVNQFLKQRYEKEYAGTTVNLNASGSDAALQRVLDGKIDLAAVGRPLTQAEIDKGLIPVSVGREKIAIIVSPDNPFKGNLTFDQFAKIFRGQITNWSQIGGSAGRIRFIDRPNMSDTRQAFRPYPVFQVAPFKTGATTTQIGQDDTAEIIQQLGKDGVSYAPYSQVQEGDVRILSMHKTLPDDPRYPFSKPRNYVYRGTPTAAVAAFLGYATAQPGQTAIAAANEAEAKAIAAGKDISVDPKAAAAAAIGATAAIPSPEATPSPDAASPSAATSPEATAPATDGTIAQQPNPSATPTSRAAWEGLLALLLLPLTAGVLWLFSRRRGSDAPASVPNHSVETPPDAALPPTSPPVATPIVPPFAGEVPPIPVAPTAAADAAIVPPPVVSPMDGLPIAGYAAGGAGVAGLAAGLPDRDGAAEMRSEDLPPEDEVVQSPSPETLEPEPTIVEQPQTVTPPIADPLVAEIPPAAVPAVAPVAFPVDPIAASAAVAGTGAAVWSSLSDRAEQSDVEASKYDVGQVDDAATVDIRGNSSLADVDNGLSQLPLDGEETQIVLMPRDPQWAYTYWTASNADREALRRQGGTRLALRLYDVTGVDLTAQNPHSLQQYDCEEFAQDWHLPVPISDRDYLVELGYLTDDGRWLLLARSLPARIPPIYPTDWSDEQFLTFDWSDDLQSQTFTELTPPRPSPTLHDTMYALSLGAETERMAGSLFGSGQAVSSYTLRSGIGMSGVGMSGVGMSGVGVTSGIGISSVGMSGIGISGIGISGIGMSGIGMMSGINMSGVGMSGVGRTLGIGALGIGMSGVGMSGIGMSGVGFSASMPSIRPRKFWLVADAELIVYGATEPDANLTIGGNPVPLNPDGTFRFQMSFPDGTIDFPILAIAADGVQSRSIHMTFDRETPVRNTNTKSEAIDEWF